MDQQHFRALYAETVGDVWRFVRRRTNSPAEADDVTAEVYAAAWRRHDDLPGDRARLWLFGAARNVLANHHRDAARRARLHLRVATIDPRPEAYNTDDGALDAHDRRGAAVWAALAALPEADRDLLLMRAWDGLAVVEIAVLLDVEPPVVSSRLHRARARLRRQLDQRDLTDDGHVPGEPPVERSTR